MNANNVHPLNLFFSYAHEDELLRDELEKHLKLLIREGVINAWYDRDITAGSEWAGQISQALESAHIILLLISADFIASDYCYDIEMKRALERHNSGEARVIPVILRDVDWTSAPFAKLQALPKNALPVKQWDDLDRAFKDVAKGIRNVAEALRNNSKSFNAPESETFVKNLPRSGAIYFEGRDDYLVQLHKSLHNESPRRDVAIAGMGGIGKTELVLQYAQQYEHYYSGGICWLRATEDVGLQIVQFGRSILQMNPPEELLLLEQVQFCWRNWPPGNVLLIFDGLIQYENIKPLLPPSNSRFYVLITTRKRLGLAIRTVELKVLSPSSALNLLQALAGSQRIQAELEIAQQLCAWLGNLPLGLELVGRYLHRKPELTLAEMQRRLGRKRLEERAITAVDTDMTAQMGVAAAFDLSWETLSEAAKRLGYLLSLFAAAPIPWRLVESVCTEIEPEDLEELRDDFLLSIHLLQRQDLGVYQLHVLIREFLQKKHKAVTDASLITQRFCSTMTDLAQAISSSLTHAEVLRLGTTIPHLREVANAHASLIPSDRLLSLFAGIGHYYTAQGLYTQAQNWYEQGLNAVKAQLGDRHLMTAQALSYLATSLKEQGDYNQAKALIKQALAIRQSLLYEDRPEVAESLDDLAVLYIEQYEFDEAEPLCLQALEIRRNHFGAEHSLVAESLNNLAAIYRNSDRFSEAENLLQQAIAIRRCSNLSPQPDLIDNLSNLAACYQDQQRYEEAEPLYIEALQLSESLFGDKHPTISLALNNLAALYFEQHRYQESEPLLVKALSMYRHFFGEIHPDVAMSLSSLASCYDELGRSLEAEALYEQALQIRESLFGSSHPDVAKTLNNLAKSYFFQQRYDEAEPLYERAIAIFAAELGDKHPFTRKVRSNLKELHDSRNRQ